MLGVLAAVTTVRLLKEDSGFQVTQLVTPVATFAGALLGVLLGGLIARRNMFDVEERRAKAEEGRERRRQDSDEAAERRRREFDEASEQRRRDSQEAAEQRRREFDEAAEQRHRDREEAAEKRRVRGTALALRADLVERLLKLEVSIKREEWWPSGMTIHVAVGRDEQALMAMWFTEESWMTVARAIFLLRELELEREEHLPHPPVDVKNFQVPKGEVIAAIRAIDEEVALLKT